MGIRNVDIIGSTDLNVGRAAIAALLAIVGTLGLFWSMLQLQLVSGTWTLAGYVTVEFPFRVWNLIWLAVRIILGLYISFVVLVIGGQLVGTWRRLVSENEYPEAAEEAEAEPARGLARFSDAQVYAHGVIALSILLLWVTGLPLTFNNALGWVYGILGGHNAVVLHGIVGGVLIVAVIFYLVYGFVGIITGETTLRYILPGMDDVWEGLAQVKYLLGRGPEPASMKYTFLQKAESWIIMFEVVVMMWTGLMLWSATQVTRAPTPLETLLTPMAAPFMMILRDIHAIVGVTMLAGITFHLFMTHVKEWPLDTSMFTGVVGLGRACEEWESWTEERAGIKDLPCEEYSWRPALTVGAIVGMGVFLFVWLGAVMQYTLAPLPSGGLGVLQNIEPNRLPGGILGGFFSVGLNVAFVVVLLAILGLAWGFKIRWSQRSV